MGMNMRRWLICVLIFVGICLARYEAAAQEWSVAEQPDLAQRIRAVKALKVEEIGSPVNVTRTGGLGMVPNPEGKSWDLLQFYYKVYGGPNTIVIMDLGSGMVKQIRPPERLVRYNFHLAPKVVAPNGKLYISALVNGLQQRLCVYDPAMNKLDFNPVKISEHVRGESHPICIGTDGMIYMGGAHSNKAATAVQIDPKTHEVTEYGPIGPSHAPSGCWGYSIAADDRYIYIASGKVPWYLVAYDRQTDKSITLAQTERSGYYIHVYQRDFGCEAFVRKQDLKGGYTQKNYWLYQGKAIEKKSNDEASPWPIPKNAKSRVILPPKPEVVTSGAAPDSEGSAEIWYRTPEVKAVLPASAPKSVVSEKLGWKVIHYKVPVYPRKIYRLVELPDGRIFGTAGEYQGNFIYDPKTEKATHLGTIRLSHYATAILEGKVYMSGYPSSPMYVYDPSKPWTAGKVFNHKALQDQDPNANPRRMVYMKASGAHKMYAAVAGVDGKVYFGGKWIRNGSGGGFAWWDPKMKKCSGMWKPFGNYQINFMTTVMNRKIVVISTMRTRDAILGKPMPEQGALFLYDTTQSKLVGRIEPVMKAKGAGLVVGVGENRVLGWTENPNDPQKSSILYGVDISNRKVLFRKKLPYKLPVPIGSNQKEPFDYRLGPNGQVWTFMGGALVRIDPVNASIHPIGKVRKGGRIAFAGSAIYLSGSESIRIIKNILSTGDAESR